MMTARPASGQGRVLSVLYVEDDKNDVFLLQTAFCEAGLKHRLEIVKDGKEALEYLAGAGGYADREKYPLPDLVLLDLKLPLRSGFDVLTWIRGEGALTGLVVVVFSSSNHPDDLKTAYRLGANSFVLKPVSCPERVAFAHAIDEWWAHWNQFAPR